MGNGARNWHKTWSTYLAAAICAIVWLRLQFATDGEFEYVIERWGWRSATDVWGGAWAALVTSAFVHIEFWHVAFNVYWLVYLGRPLERALGSVRWWLLVIAGAFVSSTCEMAVSDDTGIGFSGVVYAFFGFMWVAKRRWPGFAKFADRQTAGWFAGWLVLCFFLTYTGVWNVGNWAHLSGLAFGAATGAAIALPRWRALGAVGGGGLIAACVVVLLWAPWSSAWTAEMAYAADEEGRLGDALVWYRRYLELEPDSVWALYNMGLIRFERGESAEFESIVAKLGALDPASADELEAIAREPAD